MPCHNRRLKNKPAKGSTLLIALTMVAIITSIIIGLMICLRLDRAASASALERIRASAVAEYGVERVAAELLYYTSNTNRLWISQPGRLVVGAEQDDTSTGSSDERKILSVEIPLFSGDPSLTASSSGVMAPAWLNIKTLNGGTDRRAVSNGTADAMKLRWVYLRQDGSEDSAEQPVLTDTANPIVARYAYWTDDESTKINLNLAWKRDQATAATPLPMRHPSHVDLGALVQIDGTTPFSEVDRDLVHFRVHGTAGIPFNSLFEVKQLAGDIPPIIDLNKFGLTHYNASPVEPADRFYLTTDRKLMNSLKAKGLIPVVTPATNAASATAGLPNFIDIRINDDDDPGYLPHIWNTNAANSYRLNKSIQAISAILIRTNWPSSPGKSLIEKWFGTGLTAVKQTLLADQVAMNIIDYVRIRESKANLVVPIAVTRANLTAQTSTYTFSSYRLGNQQFMYMGGTNITANSQANSSQANDTNSRWMMIGRAPLITEISMVIDSSPRTAAQEGLYGASYWPTLENSAEGFVPPGLRNNGTLTGIVMGGAAGPVQLYRCKVYVEVYLPKYDGLPDDFVIDFSKTGRDAWPGGEAQLPPDDVFPHAAYTSNPVYNLQDHGKWFLGLPDETSSFPNKLVIDSSKACNTVNVHGSTDHRNHLTYYAKNEAGSKLVATTFGGVYADGNNYTPLSWSNYMIPLIRPSEFVGGAAGAQLRPGQRIVIAKEFFRTGPASLRQNAKMRVALDFGVPMNFSNQSGLSCSAHQPFTVAIAPFWDAVEMPLQVISSAAYDNDDTSGIQSLQINDPRMGFDPGQWKLMRSTFGSENNASDIGKSPTAPFSVAQQDTDENGMISGYSVLNAAPPAGANGSAGHVESLGELGFIHTGMALHDPARAVPWRTLRLQPDKYNDTTSQVSDWQLLDAFAMLPLDPSAYGYNALIAPHGNSRGGLVNLNAAMYPANLTTETRATGIIGLLLGARKNSMMTFSYTEAMETAKNIAGSILAAAGPDRVGKSYGYDGVLDYPAEVVQIKGVADGGEDSEDAVRQLLALGTNRSNTFTVWTVGQTLKQTPDGDLKITAERRRQVLLERYVTGTTTRIRPLYSRDVQP
jgi:hypothetical protein